MDPQTVRRLPKVLLHDHLDGGLRPGTVVELAADVGHELPETDPTALARWFAAKASSGSLPQYLETFEQTVAVMQTEKSLRRVGREAVLDLAADGVVYAELRYAPEQHQRRGLSLDAVVLAVAAGVQDGVRAAAALGRTIWVGTLVTAMRHADRGQEIAELALRHARSARSVGGVVGFDIAGAEAGFPPGRLAGAFDHLREHHLPVTIHAGEAAGLASIAEAVRRCGARRVGHGVRIIDDVRFGADGSAVLGALAGELVDNRIPLEMCPSSNVQTGAVQSFAEHPFDRLYRAGFAVTVNTDNRLMSDTSLTQEVGLLAAAHDYGLADLRTFTLTALDAAFAPDSVRRDLLERVVVPAYAAAGAE